MNEWINCDTKIPCAGEVVLVELKTSPTIRVYAFTHNAKWFYQGPSNILMAAMVADLPEWGTSLDPSKWFDITPPKDQE